MFWKIYIIIAAYFLLGAFAFLFINHEKSRAETRQNWTKYLAYLVIVHMLFFSIISGTLLFRLLSTMIALTGFYELLMLHKNSGYLHKSFFLRSVLLYGITAYGFLLFSGREQELILFTFLVIFIFDSFSQITGQLWGKRLLFPKISPRKTVGGLAGGGLMALASALLIYPVTGMSPAASLISATGIVGAAFLGDMLTSLFKRAYRVKDFSNLIPGHGGVLDRFDSLIAGGAWITLWHLIEKL
jgi:phosphatidate cytidylyltransferase